MDALPCFYCGGKADTWESSKLNSEDCNEYIISSFAHCMNSYCHQRAKLCYTISDRMGVYTNPKIFEGAKKGALENWNRQQLLLEKGSLQESMEPTKRRL